MLHIINKSPFSNNTLTLAAKHCKSSDIVIFTDDGCYALNGPHPLVTELLERGVSIKAITEHVDARGIDCDSNNCIDMPAFVDISFAQDKNMSWY